MYTTFFSIMCDSGRTIFSKISLTLKISPNFKLIYFASNATFIIKSSYRSV